MSAPAPQLSKKEQKRLADKAKTEAFNKMRRSISEAEAHQDLLELIPMMRTFKRNGLDVAATYYTKLDADLLKWALDLTDRNMHQVYEDSWGWNENKKLGELKDKAARFIVLRQGEELCGFLHFRFEFEDNISHTYIWELQIEPKFQRHGLGKYLLQCAELITMKMGIICVMLTVLKNNEGAFNFYKKNNYKLHPLSPGMADPENVNDYYHEILVKDICKKPQF